MIRPETRRQLEALRVLLNVVVQSAVELAETGELEAQTRQVLTHAVTEVGVLLDLGLTRVH